MSRRSLIEVLQPVAVGVGARQPRGDLGAEERRRHDPEGVVEDGDVEAGVVEDLGERRVGEERRQDRRLGLAGRDLDDVGVAVAARQLDEAKPVAMGVEPQRFGVDRDGARVADVGGEVALVKSDGHAPSYRGKSLRV